MIRHEKAYRAWVRERTSKLFPDAIATIRNHLNNHGLDGSDFLTCRLVSKEWKGAIDNLLQDDNKNFPDSAIIATRLSANDTMKLSSYLSKLALGTRSGSIDVTCIHPFPSKRLIVKDCFDESLLDNSVSFANTLNVLAKYFGSDVDHLEYHFKFSDQHSSDISEYWPLVKKWISRLSNLKSLTVVIPHSENSADVLQLPQYLSRHPFPHFDNLVKLRSKHAIFPWVDAVLFANPQLEDIELYQEGRHKNASWNMHNLSKLTCLKLNVSKPSQLQILTTVKWELTKLTITTLGEKDQPLNLPELFHVLENFEKTLTDLTLKIKVDGYDETSDKMYLRLPKLTHLEISFLGETDYISYDFLLPLTSLTKLNLTGLGSSSNDVREPIRIGEVIQLRGYLDRLYDSNIWSFFPKLKTVQASL